MKKYYYKKGTIKKKFEFHMKNGKNFFPNDIELTKNIEMSHNSYEALKVSTQLVINEGLKIQKEIRKKILLLSLFSDYFYNSTTKLNEILIYCFKLQKSIGFYEDDTNELIQVHSRTDINTKIAEINTLNNIKREIKNDFNNLLIATETKIRNIHSSRVTLSTIILSLTAIIIAVLSI